MGAPSPIWRRTSGVHSSHLPTLLTRRIYLSVTIGIFSTLFCLLLFLSSASLLDRTAVDTRQRLDRFSSQMAMLDHLAASLTAQIHRAVDQPNISSPLSCDLAQRVHLPTLAATTRGDFESQGYSTGDEACLAFLVQSAQQIAPATQVTRIEVYASNGFLASPFPQDAPTDVTGQYALRFGLILDVAKRLGTLPSTAPAELTVVLPPHTSPLDGKEVISVAAVRAPSDPWYMVTQIDGPTAAWDALTTDPKGGFGGQLFTPSGLAIPTRLDQLTGTIVAPPASPVFPSPSAWHWHGLSLSRSYPVAPTSWIYQVDVPLPQLVMHALLYAAPAFGLSVFGLSISWLYYVLRFVPATQRLATHTRRLQLHRRALGTLFSALPDGWALFSRDGALLFANATMRPLLTVSPTRVVQWSLPAFRAAAPHFLPPLGLERHYDDRLTIPSGDDFFDVHLHVRHGGVVLRAQMVTTERRQVTAHLQDRIALQRAEEQLIALRGSLLEAEKMAALGDMVAGLAHEVNTPLSVALVATDDAANICTALASDLKQDQLTRETLHRSLDKLRTYAELSVRNLTRAAQLVAHFKEVGANTSVEERRETDVEKLLRDALPSLQVSAAARGHTVTLHSSATPQCLLDSGLAWSIITNLVDNAITHAFDAAGGMITIRLWADDGRAHIAVADNGCGIREELAQRVWEPFFTTLRGRGGTGLGLSIVYRAVHRLDGEVALQTTVGHGSVFTVSFPLLIREP